MGIALFAQNRRIGDKIMTMGREKLGGSADSWRGEGEVVVRSAAEDVGACRFPHGADAVWWRKDEDTQQQICI